MFLRDKMLKIDILTPAGTRIMSVNPKQFNLSAHTNSLTGRLENILMIKGREIPEVESGCDVDVVSYMRSGERIKYSGHAAVSTEMQLNIVLHGERPKIMEERRRFYKIEANVPCRIINIKRNDEQLELSEAVCSRIQDFNIGGVFLCTSDTKLFPADKIQLSMELIGKPLVVEAEVLRVQKNPAGDTVGYGCRFINISPALEEVFAKFVYQAQLEAIKKNGIK